MKVLRAAVFKAKYVVFIMSVVVIVANCKMEGFVVGGIKASIIEFPYAAYLRISSGGTDGSTFMCGSSIINQDILMTAGHCLHSCKRLSKISISAGSSEKNMGHRTTALTYAVHEKFLETSSDNDIGLVRMKSRLKLSNKISRVALMDNPPQINEGKVAGWGLVNEDKLQQTNHLMKLKQVMWKKNACEDIYGHIPAGTFCAANPQHNKYVASGDSGSPFMINNYIQIGIVSYKLPKKSKFLVVYTNVTYFLRWIRFNAKRLYCRKLKIK